MINDDSDDQYGEPDNCETTNYDDLSEIELMEMEEKLIQDLLEEGYCDRFSSNPATAPLRRNRWKIFRLIGRTLFEIGLHVTVGHHTELASCICG